MYVYIQLSRLNRITNKQQEYIICMYIITNNFDTIKTVDYRKSRRRPPKNV